MTDSTLTQNKENSSLLATLRAKAWMVRWNALLWVSFLVLISIACWILFPGALFWVDGGLRGIVLVCAIDFVLGPLLAFLVANPRKSLLARRIDLIALFTVQIAAMAWGSWQVYVQHPVALTYMREGFALPVTQGPFTQQNKQPQELAASVLGKLPIFFVDIPTGPGAGIALFKLTQAPVPVNANIGILKPLFSHAEAFTHAPRFQSYWQGEGANDWQAWTSRHDNKAASDYRFILLAGRYGNAALVLDMNNELLGHIPMPDGDPTLILPAK